jgi:hypothetical protein
VASILCFAACVTGCCHSTCESELAPPRSPELDPGGVVTVGSDAGIICTGVIIRAEKLDEAWRHQVLTAKHCFGEYRGELPTAEVRALVDGGYETFRSRLEVWSSRSVNYSGPIAVGNDTVRWVADDWAIVTFDATIRLRTIPLASDQEAGKLRKDDFVQLASFLDAEWPMKLRYHTHDFPWGAVPPELSQDGHSGSPILRNGKVVGIYVAAVTNSVFCRSLFGCRERASEYVSAEAIRGSAQRQGFLVD